MRFVLSEYLGSLKEDRELDSFLIELVKSMQLIPMTKIQRGRQYGVDLAAVGTDEDGNRKLFLFVVKQGNISRKNWDGGNVNDIRPSIVEILDVYINTRIPKPYDKLPIKIVVCSNGEFETAVQENWTQFVNKHTNENLEFDFWDINRLVNRAEKYQMAEEILTPDLAMNFRRALSFIDLPDYNLSHVNKFIQTLLPAKEANSLIDKQVIRKIRLANLCMSIIHIWCEKSNNLKPAYIASERILLTTFKWLIGNEYVNKKNIWTAFYASLQNWRALNHKYLERTAEYYTIKDGLGIGIANHNEYCLVTFEQIGILGMMGNYELWECSLALTQNDAGAFERANYAFKNAEAIANLLVRLVENNSASAEPRFDEHIVELNLGLVLLYETGIFGTAVKWLKEIIDKLILNVKIANFFPLFHTNIENLNTEKANKQESSLLANFLAEWCLILRQLGYYHSLRKFLKEDLPQLNLQLWLPSIDTDDVLYSDNASVKSGVTIIGLEIPENHLKMEMHISEERVIMNEEKGFAYQKYFLSFMSFLSSRHFRTYPFPNTWRCYLRTNFCFSENPVGND
jgi:hypothetical protein